VILIHDFALALERRGPAEIVANRFVVILRVVSAGI
jgi:hypothetical protein